MKILWIFFGVTTKLGYISGSFLCILGSFLKVKVQNGDIFWVAKISNFLGVLEISDIFFWVKGRCWARAYVCTKNEITPLGRPSVR